MDDEIEVAEYAVVCHAEGCQNKDITINLLGPAVDPHFVCGAHVNSEGLNEEITDVVLVN